MTKLNEMENPILRTGTPVVDNGMFYLATPLGPSAKINLREMFRRMSKEDLLGLKTLVNNELDRKMCADLKTHTRGVEL